MALSPLHSSVSNPVDLAGKTGLKSGLVACATKGGEKQARRTPKVAVCSPNCYFYTQFSLPVRFVLGCLNWKQFSGTDHPDTELCKSMNRVNCSQEYKGITFLRECSKIGVNSLQMGMCHYNKRML